MYPLIPNSTKLYQNSTNLERCWSFINPLLNDTVLYYTLKRPPARPKFFGPKTRPARDRRNWYPTRPKPGKSSVRPSLMMTINFHGIFWSNFKKKNDFLTFWMIFWYSPCTREYSSTKSRVSSISRVLKSRVEYRVPKKQRVARE